MKKNTVRIKITGEGATAQGASYTPLAVVLERIAHLRSARNIGDEETINLTMLGDLKRSGAKFEILNP